MRTDEQDRDGFTLIELLIVMSVMLILMTLAVPQMLKLTQAGAGDFGGSVGADDWAGGAAVQLGLSAEWVCLLAGGAGGRSEVGCSVGQSLRS